ncbi:MAG: pirin family protein [Pseudomonadota bacterium]|nr:pirin family protein [Pseudomonadota bacterium]
MAIELRLSGHDKDLGGGFLVRRLLPSAQRPSVGPFVFLDHFGPLDVQPGEVHDVRPHPHIGLATVSYLFDGALMHRDSLGSVQRIEPGAINWMTAGRGIVHSERAPEDLRQQAYRQHGLQLWAALPKAYEEVAPEFVHTPAAAIPVVSVGASQVRVLIGQAFGCVSPVRTFSRTVYLDIRLAAGETLALPPLADELALYAIDAALSVAGEPLAARTLAILTPGVATPIRASAPVRFVVIGGEALDGARFLWWNFVSSRKERIAQAGDDWTAQTMGRIEGDDEFIPLPERRLPPAETDIPKTPYL